MDHSLKCAERLIAILSDKYLESLYAQAEWMVAFSKDPLNEKHSIIPVRIADVVPQGLLGTVIYIDLHGISDDNLAKRRLLDGVGSSIMPNLRNRPAFPSTKKNVNFNTLNIKQEEYSSIRFGIITALPKELSAVRLILIGQKKVIINNRLYYIGKIPAAEGGEHLVAIALLADMGNNISAISATHLFRDFDSIEHVIMCGIAGGIPNASNIETDIRLGDIVVSNRNGVVQYDFIKQMKNGIKEYRFPPRPPSSVLLSAVRMLQSDEELGLRPWEEFLQLGKDLASGCRPNDNVDAQGNELTYPSDSSRRDGYPKIHYGTIAAANILLKDIDTRDYLSNNFGVKAIEMESSGIADATWADDKVGYLVVRGICDYCDEKKGDIWQGAASIAAVSYVRALISSIPLNL